MEAEQSAQAVTAARGQKVNTRNKFIAQGKEAQGGKR